MRFGCVLADAGYGMSAPFRHALTERNVGIPLHLKVYPVDVQLIWPLAGRGRLRQRHIPDVLSKVAAEDMAHHHLANRHADEAWLIGEDAA